MLPFLLWNNRDGYPPFLTAPAAMNSPVSLRVPALRNLGLRDYLPVWRSMQDFTAARTTATSDEIWLTQHPPVYTLGLAGKPEHLLQANTGVPMVKTDRGGQITFHGPGQLVAYTLLDIKRRGLGVRALVRKLESAVIDLLAGYHIAAYARADAPGVYVTLPERGGTEAKIAALGLRVKNGCCYHGLALNIDMDLAPFLAINPCGYAGLAVTQLRDLDVRASVESVSGNLTQHLLRVLA